MRAALERALLARWYGRPGLMLLFWPLECLFRGIAALRRAVRTRSVPSVPVVVVGNLTVGGSGKTPLVLALLASAKAAGLKVGVISRGHGGSGPFPLLVDAGTSPAHCGDEPALIARRGRVPVVVDPDRRRALRHLERIGVELVLSDDGLQHYRLPRTVEIVVLDDRRRFGNRHCLPVGPLREPPARLAGADFVIGNGGEAGIGAEVMMLKPVAVRRLVADGESVSLADFVARCGAEVEAVAGIGDPSRFFSSLREAGLRVNAHPFPDHHAFRAADFAAFAGRTVLMTAKDAVKCTGLPGMSDAWYLEIEALLPDDFAARVFARAGVRMR